MKLIAINTINLGVNKSVVPGGEFEVSDAAEAKSLIESGAAARKTKVVDDDGDTKLPLTDVLSMADKDGVSFAAFKAAAGKHLATVPSKKEDIVAALLALPPEQPDA